MFRRAFVVVLFASVLFADGVTSRLPVRISGVVPSGNVCGHLRGGGVRAFRSSEVELEDVLDCDSVRTVLLPGEAVFFRVDASANTVELVDERDTLPAACWDAIYASPVWLRDDLYQSFRHLDATSAETYAGIILSAPEEQIDEVAFCVAHMAPQTLTDERLDPELLLLNAEFIYRLADSLEYVELLEYGNVGSGDWYTTTAYWVTDSTLADTFLLEMPREIYYWYVVHPKLSDESVKMDDFAGDTRERTYGYFWRQYLWMDDTSGVHPYTDGGYPLLADWVKMAKVLWIRNDTVLTADRWVGPENGALDIIGEWVSTLLPDPPGAVRPIQPNQIAYYHSGNCGEVQDLLAAACRTALIPDLCVGTLLQDHVWNEFWDDGFPGELWEPDAWHTYQVDRWGGNTALAPHWGGYDTDRGGSKHINNCIGWRGDGYAIDRTPAYTRVCTLMVEVLDAAGNPVPGAQVLLASNSYYDTTGLYVADIRATDARGMMVVSMGDGCPYYFRVDSPVGSEPPSSGTVTAFPTLGSGTATAGEIYVASVSLSGVVSTLPVTEVTSTGGDKQLRVVVNVPYEYIRGPGVFDSRDITYSLRSQYGVVTVFVCDSANFEAYRAGSSFEAYEYYSRISEGWFILDLPSEGVWYVVLSSEETINNDNLVVAEVALGYDLEHVVHEGKPRKASLTVEPNPFNGACVISFRPPDGEGRVFVTDIAGRRVADFVVAPGEGEVRWDAAGESSGVYLVTLVADDRIEQRRVVLLK